MRRAKVYTTGGRLHTYHTGRNGCATVVISSDDTDVFVLCLAFKCLIPSTVYMKCGTQARTRYIDITHVVQRHGSELFRCLPGLHAFTCCASVSAFSGYQALGTEWEVSVELFTRLHEFTCFMYSSNPGASDVNDLRYRLLCTKKRDLDSNQLPTCVVTLRKHCDRTIYQAAIWCRSLQSCPQIPSPVGHGWSVEEGRLIVNWMSGEPAPMAVELLSCQCKRRCHLPNCTCLSNGVDCKTVPMGMRTRRRLSPRLTTTMMIRHIFTSRRNVTKTT